MFFRIRLSSETGFYNIQVGTQTYYCTQTHIQYSSYIIPKKTESFPWKLIYRRNVRFIRILFEHKRNLFSFRLHKGAFLCNLVEFKKNIVFAQ